jgi:hypothetical protein
MGNRPTAHYSYAGNNPVSNTDPNGLDVVLGSDRGTQQRNFNAMLAYAPGLKGHVGFEFSNGKVFVDDNFNPASLSLKERAMYYAIQKDTETYDLSSDAGWQSHVEGDFALGYGRELSGILSKSLGANLQISSLEDIEQVETVLATKGEWIRNDVDLYAQLFMKYGEARWYGRTIVNLYAEQATANVGGRILGKLLNPVVSRFLGSRPLKLVLPADAEGRVFRHVITNGEIRRVLGNGQAGRFTGMIDFVVTKDGQLILGRAHSFMSGGAEEVLHAGQLVFNRHGQLIRITRISGHYKPSIPNLNQAVDVLKQRGVDTTGVTIDPAVPD